MIRVDPASSRNPKNIKREEMITKHRLIKYLLGICVLAAAAACGRVGSEGTAAQPGNVEPDVLVLTHGFIIDGTGAEPVSNGMVVIQDGRIIAVGPMDTSSFPPGATILDVQGATVLLQPLFAGTAANWGP